MIAPDFPPSFYGYRNHQPTEVERLRVDLAAANAALASVSDLLDQARTERDEARDVVDTCHEYSLGLARELGDVRAELARWAR